MNNIEDFGASPAATPAANKAAIEDAIAAGPTYIPPKPFTCDQIVSPVSDPFISGDGYRSRIISTSAGSAIRVPITTNAKGLRLRDFSLAPAAPHAGATGIEFVMTPTGSMGCWSIAGVRVEPFGGAGLVFDNSIAKGDGFFNGVVRECYIEDGLKGILIGDSITLVDTIVTGKNNVTVSQVPGARQFQIRGGQITTQNGFLVATDMGGMRIEDVWFEHPSYLSQPPAGTTGILITRGNHNAMTGCTFNVGDPNSVGYVPFAQTIALSNTAFTRILDNEFMNRGNADIYGTALTNNTVIRDSYYAGRPPVVVLQGS